VAIGLSQAEFSLTGQALSRFSTPCHDPLHETRRLGLLIFRNSFKVGLVELDSHLGEERIVERHTARGEKNAIALAKRLAAQGEETGEQGA
jgi:hypothetical protein